MNVMMRFTQKFTFRWVYCNTLAFFLIFCFIVTELVYGHDDEIRGDEIFRSSLLPPVLSKGFCSLFCFGIMKRSKSPVDKDCLLQFRDIASSHFFTSSEEKGTLDEYHSKIFQREAKVFSAMRKVSITPPFPTMVMVASASTYFRKSLSFLVVTFFGS